MSAEVFESFLSAPSMRAVFAPASVVQALLDVEAALVRAQAAEGRVPAAAAQAIAGVCKAELFDVPALVAAATRAGSLPGPLVAQLRATVALFDAAAAEHVHRDIADRDLSDAAMTLLARRALALVDEALSRLIEAPWLLAHPHAAGLSRCRQRLREAGARCLRLAVGTGSGIPLVSGWGVRLAQGLQLGGPVDGDLQDEAVRLQAELGLLCSLLARLSRDTFSALPPAVSAAALRAPQQVAALLAALGQGAGTEHAACAESAGLWFGAHGALVALVDAAAAQAARQD